jgi:phospholipid transport system substrate-binding protein
VRAPPVAPQGLTATRKQGGGEPGQAAVRVPLERPKGKAMMLRSVLVAATLLSLGGSGIAFAAPDPGVVRVEGLCGGVLEAVKQAKGANAQVRARRIQPVIEQSFNLEVMAQFTIGEAWTKMSAAERASIVTALTHYTAARYAHEFDNYNGQHCVVDSAVVTRGLDKLVKSQIVEAGEATAVNYRLRDYAGAWRVIDVYYSGVSQLATQRADFASIVRSAGAQGLTAKLNALTSEMR